MPLVVLRVNLPNMISYKSFSQSAKTGVKCLRNSYV